MPASPRLVRCTAALVLALSAVGAPAQVGAQHRPAAQERPAALRPFGSDRALERELRRLAPPAPARVAATCPGAVTVGRRRTRAGRTKGAVLYGHVRGGTGSGTTVGIAALGLGTTTGEGGRYRLEIVAARLPAARALTLAARRIGFTPASRTLTVGPGDSVAVDFALCARALALESAVVTGVGVSAEAAAPPPVDAAPPPPPPAPAAAARAAPGTDAVTNTQHAGVDEGDIVKRAGDYLVILRRGRLFTVAVGGDALRPAAAADAFGPGIDPAGTWYDELLVSGDQVVVTGYSYARGGTEVGLFRLGADGALAPRGTYQLRSYDYYSSRNYATRLAGGRLIFYAPLGVRGFAGDPAAVLPAFRRWDPGAPGGGRFRPAATAATVFRAAAPLGPGDYAAIHTVTTCDLAGPDFACRATAVLGPAGRVFYVSPNAVYVWTGGGGRPGDDSAPPAVVYRLPLDGSAPQALAAAGSPVDQFSFEEGADGRLRVLVRTGTRGDGMWDAERAGGEAALLDVPLALFGDGSRAAPAGAYRPLPLAAAAWRAGGRPYARAFHNRWVAGHLLYGEGGGWGRPGDGPPAGDTLFVVPRRGAVARVALPHGVDRIEAMGADAVVVGAAARDLHFTGVRLGAAPAVRQRHVLADATQGELRSHGFFYRPDGPDEGVLGLPVRTAGRPGYAHLVEGSAAVTFLRNADGDFAPLGALAASDGAPADDRCRASCVDWYGNARPLFTRGRVFALLGYELVEGRVRGGAIDEVARVDFGPAAVRAVRR